MGFFSFWLLYGILSAILAKSKGLSVYGWFLMGVVFGPFGLILTFVAPEKGPDKKSPFSAEVIKGEAVVCHFCGHALPEESIQERNDSFTESIGRSAGIMIARYGWVKCLTGILFILLLLIYLR
ncbi:hypothetical protein ACFL6K_03865 [Candidatus Latescibacterota bacterium]